MLRRIRLRPSLVDRLQHLRLLSELSIDSYKNLCVQGDAAQVRTLLRIELVEAKSSLISQVPLKVIDKRPVEQAANIEAVFNSPDQLKTDRSIQTKATAPADALHLCIP